MIDNKTAEEIHEARAKFSKLLAELHKIHLAMLNESRALKKFTQAGRSTTEMEIFAEFMEQYMASTDAFSENMRARMEVRLGVIRRGEPVLDGVAEKAPGHGTFWLSFSRLTSALKRIERRLSH